MMSVDSPLLDSLALEIARDGIQKIVCGAVILHLPREGEAQCLLLERAADDFMGGLVELPSGGVDVGEELIGALHREVLEETGLQGQVEGYLGAFDYLSGSGKKARQLNFLMTSLEKSVRINPAEHSQFYWLTQTDLANTELKISVETSRIVIGGFGALDGIGRR
ncbi:NUDIX hydrolase [Bradyrhizobium pachyrhizi]|uniref:NUDIX hydrolase n=1 Tax=Bradyrhizobium pachyrhizi TaxID=280333 RepID=UPI0009E3814A|nr:NUDIX hydrolase [Bradyrhizobium pachyrhizi]